MLVRVVFVLYAVVTVQGCSRNSECAGEAQCELNVSPASESTTVGDPLILRFDLFADAKLAVDVFEDPLCQLMFNVKPKPYGAVIGTRKCASTSSRLPTNVQKQLVKDPEIMFSWSVANSRRLFLGPNKHEIYELRAQTAQQSDGAVYIHFSDDVYFSFCDTAIVYFGLRPHYNTFFSSGEGSFGDWVWFEQVQGENGSSIEVKTEEMGFNVLEQSKSLSSRVACLASG